MDSNLKSKARTVLQNVHDADKAVACVHGTSVALLSKYQGKKSSLQDPLVEGVTVAEEYAWRAVAGGQEIEKLLEQDPLSDENVEQLSALVKFATDASANAQKTVLWISKISVMMLEAIHFPKLRLWMELTAEFETNEWRNDESRFYTITARFVDSLDNESHRVILKAIVPLNLNEGQRPILTVLRSIRSSVSNRPGSSASRPPPNIPVLQMILGLAEHANPISRGGCQVASLSSPYVIPEVTENGASTRPKVFFVTRWWNMTKNVLFSRRSSQATTSKTKITTPAIESGNGQNQVLSNSATGNAIATEQRNKPNNLPSKTKSFNNQQKDTENEIPPTPAAAESSMAKSERNLATAIADLEEVIAILARTGCSSTGRLSRHHSTSLPNINIVSPSSDEGYKSASTSPQTQNPERAVSERSSEHTAEGHDNTGPISNALENRVNCLMTVLPDQKQTTLRTTEEEKLWNPSRKFPLPKEWKHSSKNSKKIGYKSCITSASSQEAPILQQNTSRKVCFDPNEPTIHLIPSRELEKVPLSMLPVVLRNQNERHEARGHLARRHAVRIESGVESKDNAGEVNRDFLSGNGD